MKFAAVFLWWPYRHQLKANGYSLDQFSRMMVMYWRTLISPASKVAKKDWADVPVGPEFERQQLRARW